MDAVVLRGGLVEVLHVGTRAIQTVIKRGAVVG
jgi:hypothetical protein